MTLGDQHPGQPYGHGYGGAPQGPSSGGVYGTPRHEPGHGQPGGPPPGGREYPGHGQPGYGQPGAGQYGQPAGQPGYGQPDPYGPPPPGGGQHPGQPEYGSHGQPAGHGGPGGPGGPGGAPGQHGDPFGVPAAPGFGDSQFAEPPGFGPPPPPPKGGSRFWLATLGVLAVVVVIAACSVGGYFMFRDDGSPSTQPAPSSKAPKKKSPSASPSPTSSPVDISSRATDPKPLTEKELFGSKTLSVQDDSTGTNRSYKVVKTQATESCKKGATGELGSTLGDLGCSQLVRAAINSSDGKYGATAGVFNLKKKGHSDKINPLIKKDRGSFTGLEGAGASAKINKASLALYWEERGHYMVYVIICRGDGKQISLEDKKIQNMASDLLIGHLATKLAERTGTVD